MSVFTCLSKSVFVSVFVPFRQSAMTLVRRTTACFGVSICYASGESFSILSGSTGKCLGAGNDESFLDGLQLSARTCTERSIQSWEFNITSSAAFPMIARGLLQLAAVPSMCLTAPSSFAGMAPASVSSSPGASPTVELLRDWEAWHLVGYIRGVIYI